MAQFYVEREIPPELIVAGTPTDSNLLARALSEHAGQRVRIRSRVRDARGTRWIEMARDNARIALRARLATRAGYARRLEALREALELERAPARMECFDVSHTRGECTVASCVVFDGEGARKSDYRRYNIEGIAPGDDYAAMRQALTRRYTRVKSGEYPLPDVLFIDGGRGQLSVAAQVLRELGVDGVAPVGVAKGPRRQAGTEELWLLDRQACITLPGDSPAMHLIAQIRDEAHRFALTGHRARRGKARTHSGLERIAGIGPTRRQRLLKQFGGLRGLASASLEEIAAVEGISRQLAQRILDSLQPDEQGFSTS